MEISSKSSKHEDSLKTINSKRQEFLDRLITQMQNQVGTLQKSNHALYASTLVGRKVLVESDNFNLESEGAVKIFVQICHDINNLSALIFTECNKLIKVIPLVDPHEGLFSFYWNGLEGEKRLPPGKYRVEVSGFNQNMKQYLKTMVLANVDSVNLNHKEDSLKLNISGIGSLLIDEVKKISV